MNIQQLKLTLKNLTEDRQLIALMASLLVAGVAYCLSVGLSVHQSYVTVYTRYTAFGEAHFYKDHWQYLITFVMFGLVVTFAHLAFMVKLVGLERRQTAITIGWLGIVMLGIAAAYSLAVMHLGRVS